MDKIAYVALFIFLFIIIGILSVVSEVLKEKSVNNKHIYVKRPLLEGGIVFALAVVSMIISKGSFVVIILGIAVFVAEVINIKNWRIEVLKTFARYRNFFGVEKEFKFCDITECKPLLNGTFAVVKFIDGRKIFLNENFIGYNSFFRTIRESKKDGEKYVPLY